MRPVVLALALLAGCTADPEGPSPTATTEGLGALAAEDSALVDRLGLYATARLAPDLSALSDSVGAALPHLLEAARLMNAPFLTQAGADLDTLPRSEAARRYAAINYGPWDRLDGDAPFLPGVGPKPAGAGFYPPDLREDDLFATADLYPELGLTNRTTIVRRDGGSLVATPAHEAFASEHGRAAAHLQAAAAQIGDSTLARALGLRAEALLDGDLERADATQAALSRPVVDVIAGPAETFEDALTGRKAAHAGAVLLRVDAWTERLAEARRQLAADSVSADGPTVEVVDAALLAGQANAGPKPIALDLPAGADAPARRAILRNVIEAKAEHVLRPLAETMLTATQRDLVTPDAFVQHVVLHELAHGAATGSAALDEAAADARALRLAARLADADDASWAPFEAVAATYLAAAIRAVRFGAAGARGRAHLVVLNRLLDSGAVVVDPEDDTWRVTADRVVPALDALLQDLDGLSDPDPFVRQWGRSPDALDRALDRLDAARIPADVVFQQGPVVLGLPPASPLPPARRGARM